MILTFVKSVHIMLVFPQVAQLSIHTFGKENQYCRIVEDNMKVTTSFVYDKVSAVAEQIKHKTIDPDNASVLVSDC